MLRPKSLFKALTKTRPLIAAAAAITILVSIAGPASAQFFGFPDFNFGGPRHRSPRGGGGGWFGGDFFGGPPQEQRPQQPRQDFSRAPPPVKRETVPTRNVLVIGDGMADWLAYGLEDAYADQPDMGVLRRHKTNSGLIKYQPKGEPSSWAAAAKGILASEKPDIIVVMLGLSDRIAIREPPPVNPQGKPNDPKNQGKPNDAKNDVKNDVKPGGTDAAAAKPDDKSTGNEVPQDEADNGDAPQVMAPEKPTRSASGGLYEFRDEHWGELYSKKIAELIGVLKTKGVPVLWVGLPAIRGPKGTADVLFLDSLYRESASKAGITYVDVWDGFVDDAGSFLQKGPDFEGQIRQLRSSDGVYFTKPGARKLAHYVEREITHLLAGRTEPIALPIEPATPDINAVPGEPARPLAGPIVPLAAALISKDQLLGGPGSRPAAIDALAERTLVKGEPLAPAAGRADDYSWPRREVGLEQAKGDTPVAEAPEGAAATPASERAAAAAIAPPRPAPRRPPVQQPARLATPSFFDLFNFSTH